MQTAQRNSLRLLQWMMVASLALPLTLFVLLPRFPGSRSMRPPTAKSSASLDVAHEHALKVFETIDRSLSEIAEIIHGFPMPALSPRANAAPAAEAVRRFAAAGEIRMDFRRQRPCAGQQPGGAGPRHRFLRPGLFQRPCRRRYRDLYRRGVKPRPPYQGAAFFGVSRRRPNEDGSFAGVIQASVLPGIFREFLRPDRPRARQLLCARPDRRHGAGPLSRRVDRELRLDRNGPAGQQIVAHPKPGSSP